MNTNSTKNPVALHSWLDNIQGEIQSIKRHRIAMPRPARNRSREKARREARRLFREYELDCDLQINN